jgi:hypothetical protein
MRRHVHAASLYAVDARRGTRAPEAPRSFRGSDRRGRMDAWPWRGGAGKVEEGDGNGLSVEVLWAALRALWASGRYDSVPCAAL